MMAEGLGSIPEGWSPPGHSNYWMIAGSIFMLLSGWYLAYRVNGFDSLYLFLSLLMLAVLIWVIWYNINDPGRNPGDLIRVFPVIELEKSNDKTLKPLIASFEPFFKDFQRVADPTGGPLRAKSTRFVYSGLEQPERVIKIGYLEEELLEFGVSTYALDTIPRIESYFKLKGRKGSSWIIPDSSYEFRFFPFIFLMIIGGLVPFLFIYPHEGAWIFLIVDVAILIPLLFALKNYKVDRLLHGSIQKHLTIDDNEARKILERAAKKLDLSIYRIDNEIPYNKDSNKSDYIRINNMYRIEEPEIFILLTNRMINGIPQGYLTIYICRYYRIDELITKRLMKAFDEVLENS